MDRQRLEELAERHGIVLLVRFGSRVTGRVHPGSDVDVGVLLRVAPRSFREVGELIGDLQPLFPEGPLDLAILNRADPLFLKKVTDSCRLVFGSPRRLLELKLYAFKRYQDHRKYLAMERAYLGRLLAAAPPA